MQYKVPDDHRVRVGREKRERMQKRLLSAVMSCYAAREDHTTPRTEDIMQEAGVSRATFYLYFDSIEDAFNALLAELDNDLKLVEQFFERSDALARLATGALILLLRSVTDPVWAKFVSRTSYLSVNAALLTAIEHHLLEAQKSKLVRFSEVTAARSLLLGTLGEAMRFLANKDHGGRAYVEEVTVMVLTGLGAARDRCEETVRERLIYIRGYAPDCLPWWKDPWTSSMALATTRRPPTTSRVRGKASQISAAEARSV